MNSLWSWVLGIVGTTGIFFVGSKNKWAWFLLIFNECLWVSYATVTKQYGFYFASLAYVVVYIRNILNWNKKDG
jgi:hypothetical protein